MAFTVASADHQHLEQRELPSLDMKITLHIVAKMKVKVMSDTLWPNGLWPAGVLCPWNSSGQNTRVGSSLLPEKAMAPHSSTLAWEIPWMEEPGGLQYMGSLRVRHDWATFSLFTFMHWRRKWQPTPVFLPGESQGRGSLVGCCLWGCTESDTTEVT